MKIKGSLHNYTTYTKLYGSMVPASWPEVASKLGYEYLALTDINSMAGAIQFQGACDKHKIKPIFGETFLLVDDIDKASEDIAGTIILYAKNSNGMGNLIEINNKAQLEGFYYRPRLSLAMLEGLTDDLIAVIPVSNGAYIDLKKTSDDNLTPVHPQKLIKLSGLFSELYIGLNPLIDFHKDCFAEYFKNMYWVSSSIPTVFSFHAVTPAKEHQHLHQILRDMDNGKCKKTPSFPARNSYLPVMEDINAINHGENGLAWPDDILADIIARTDAIADACNYRFPTGKPLMPKASPRKTVEEDLFDILIENFNNKIFDLGDSVKTLADFAKLNLNNYKGIYAKIYLKRGDSFKEQKYVSEYIASIVDELTLYKAKDFLDYFHIANDIVMYGYSKSGVLSPGRGSVGGSTIAYLVSITCTDAHRHGLLRERFLNSDRNDAPDIDMDFPPDVREDIINNYLPTKYGSDCVIPIGTYARTKIKSMIKKFAESKGYAIPNDDGTLTHYTPENLSQVLDSFVKATLRGEEELESLMDNYQFSGFYKKHSKWIESIVMPLLETVTNISVHAGGVVISPESYRRTIPIQWNANNSKKCMITQWEGPCLEKRGLIKFDILGVKALSVVSTAQNIIKSFGMSYLELDDIPLNDEPTLLVFFSGKTSGVFQFSSYLQKAYLPQFQPCSFSQVTNCIAVKRPGVMEEGGDTVYLEVHHKTRKAKYLHKDLKPILSTTGGVLVYQEQMMAIARLMGLTMSESDYLRKACGKKKVEEMNKWEDVFKSRGAEKGYDQEVLDSLWHSFVSSASYLFNKSHAVSYTLLSWQQAYLKAHFPQAFWCGALTFASTDKKKDNSVFQLKYAAEDEGVEFVFPTINDFSIEFRPVSMEGNQIYWPITSIKRVGEKSAEKMTNNGTITSFKSLEEFSKASTLTTFKALLIAGFFDPLGAPWEIAAEYYAMRNEPVPFEFDHSDLFEWAKMKQEAFGFQVDSWKKIAPFNSGVGSYHMSDLALLRDKSSVLLGGIVELVRIERTAKGEKYASILIVDRNEKYFIKIWPDIWQDERLSREKRRPSVGDVIEIYAKKQTYKGKPSLVMESIDSPLRIVWKAK